MAPKKRTVPLACAADAKETHVAAVSVTASLPMPLKWDECEFTLLHQMRPSLSKRKHYGRVIRFTLPKDAERGGSKFVNLTLMDASGEFTVMLFEDMFAHFLGVLSQYDVVVRIASLGIQRATKGNGYWGRITRKTQVEILGAHFAFDDVREKPPEDTTFVLDDLKTCYDMVEGTVDLHVYVMERHWCPGGVFLHHCFQR